jgi:uncharacterized protein YegL
MNLARRIAPVGLLFSMIGVACGGDPSSQFDPNDPSRGGANGSGDGAGGGVFKGTEGDGGAGGVNSQCATSSSTPTPVPVNLVVMFDKSGSMAQNSKWTACAAGLNAFFADPKSAGLSASLQFFPLSTACGTQQYQAQAVSLRPLPDAQAFSAAIAAQSPNGGTPTNPALQGALAYGAQVQQQRPGEKVAVVLVTDGEPNDCSSTVQAVSTTAQKGHSQGIPTYVIGVGNVNNLNAIAQAGGTTQATIVQTNNPQQTTTDFQNALNAIRGAVLACEYVIPPPPTGQTLDFNKVNVVFTPTSGPPKTLNYSKDCSDPKGWKYDNEASPKRILLCKDACSTAQADKGGKIEIVLGCTTQTGGGAN